MSWDGLTIGSMTSAPPPPPPSGVPAGWYPNGDVQRYWDGSTWTEHTAPLAVPAPAPQAPAAHHAQGGPLMQFSSHIAGRNAQVQIYADRVEWTKAGMLGTKGTEMVPMRSISAVTSRKDGLLNTVVQVTTGGGVIDMRVPHALASEVRRCLMDQMLR